MWRKLKKIFGGKGGSDEPPPNQQTAEVSKPVGGATPPRDPTAVGWLADVENPYGVPVVDLRPFALTMLSTSSDPQMAANAGSYGGDDGATFVDQLPASSRVTDCALRFRIDRVLLEGALFQPQAMEDKWALYFRAGRILCVRSWTRRVHVTAQVRVDGDFAVVGPITGTFGGDEDPDLVVRQLAFVLRSHALEETLPAPLPSEPADLQTVTLAMFSLWGRRAQFATHHPLAASSPVRPLRTESLLHIAVARGDRATVETYLAQGVPMNVLARDGLGIPHWALGSADPDMLGWLLDRGCPVDVRSTQGATPLMNAVQGRKLERVRLLLERGAEVNAADLRGFTSLHRAAEMGELEIARLLLDRGANAEIAAAGKTPLALAEFRNEAALIALLKAHAPS